VVGAGIVGVTTAYELAADGHRVTVFERRGSVAAEASFANAGLIGPGHAGGWCDVAADRSGWLFRGRAASRQSGQADLRHARQELAAASLEHLDRLTRELHLEGERGAGCLRVFRTARERAAAEAGLGELTAGGIRADALDAAQCRAIEPGLDADAELHSGINFPDDAVANCRQFALALRQEAERLGARFRFHAEVTAIVAGRVPQLSYRRLPSSHASSAVARAAPQAFADTEPMHAQPSTHDFDAVVVCAAIGAPALLRPLGVRLPMQAVHGWSITAPVRVNEAFPDLGPRSALLDERHRVAVVRLGARVRVAGGGVTGAPDGRRRERAIAQLYQVLHDWFPGATHLRQMQPWHGTRAVFADGILRIGPSGAAGVWLNLGHDNSGWALACGSARRIADAIAGRAAAGSGVRGG
jgi:D-amino-acid dehydrogenase